MKVRLFPILAVLAAVAVGCKSEPYNTAPVSGRITVDGKAVANIEVMFQPVHTQGNYTPGPGSYGITDADGRYTLKIIGKESAGAVVGKHKVRFGNYSPPGDPSDDRPRVIKHAVTIPAKYNDIEGKMEFEVPSGGTTAADFNLVTK